MNRVVSKKKKTLHPFRILVLIIIVSIIIFCSYEYKTYGNLNRVTEAFSNINISKTNTVGQSYSSKNLIAGQTKVENQDGYTTTFTTLNTKEQKTYKEYKQNQEASWSKNDYWGGTMAENGCGITSMAIVLSGYGYNITPEDLREKYYPHLDFMVVICQRLT